MLATRLRVSLQISYWPTVVTKAPVMAPLVYNVDASPITNVIVTLINCCHEQNVFGGL